MKAKMWCLLLLLNTILKLRLQEKKQIGYKCEKEKKLSSLVWVV